MNAIAREIVVEILGNDFSREVIPGYVDQAAEAIINRRDTHIDSLMERLREHRVQRIVEPVILGEVGSYDILDDDYQYVLDLGLLTEIESCLRPSNPMYSEVILRTLSSRAYMEMEKRAYPPRASAYLAQGKMDMQRLFSDFQQFWRENCEIWTERFEYKEAAPHLVLMAFLQRIINIGGRIEREIAEGNGRLDLCLYYDGGKYPIEIKIRYGSISYKKGKEKLSGYMDRMGCEEGWLVVFDRRPKISWGKKILWKSEENDGKIIHIVGC